MSDTLFIYTRQSLSLSDALDAFGLLSDPEHTVAILYAPAWCRLAKWESGRLHGHDGKALDIAPVFEARVFNPMAELRWLNDPGPEQRHQAVILTEQDMSERLESSWQMQASDGVEKLSQTYLLWGEGTGRPMTDGWSELATPRIGALPVPVSGIGANQRVRLKSIEYLVESDYGNIIVFDKRLSKLEVTHA